MSARRRPARQKKGSPTPKPSAPAAARPKTPRRRGNNRVPIELTIEREEQCWDLYKVGHLQTEIAALLSTPEFTFSQPSVSKALARVEERAIQRLDEKAERHKVRQLARLDGIYGLAMSSFRMSMGWQKQSSRRTERGAKTGETEVTQLKAETSPGDPRFLEKALEALRDQRKILGVDAPTKFDGVIRERPFEDVPLDELAGEIAAGEGRIAEIRKRMRT